MESEECHPPAAAGTEAESVAGMPNKAEMEVQGLAVSDTSDKGTPRSSTAWSLASLDTPDSGYGILFPGVPAVAADMKRSESLEVLSAVVAGWIALPEWYL